MQIRVHPRGPRAVSRDGNLKWSRAKSGPRRVYKSIQYIVMNPSFAYGELFILATRKCKIFHRMNNSSLDFLHTKVATFSVLRNVRFSFVLIIWPDCYYFEIFRPWASRSRFSCISWTAYISNGRSPILFNESSQALQHSQSSQPSIQDDDNIGDSAFSFGVTKEIVALRSLLVRLRNASVNEHLRRECPTVLHQGSHGSMYGEV